MPNATRTAPVTSSSQSSWWATAAHSPFISKPRRPRPLGDAASVLASSSSPILPGLHARRTSRARALTASLSIEPYNYEVYCQKTWRGAEQDTMYYWYIRTYHTFITIGLIYIIIPFQSHGRCDDCMKYDTIMYYKMWIIMPISGTLPTSIVGSRQLRCARVGTGDPGPIQGPRGQVNRLDRCNPSVQHARWTVSVSDRPWYKAGPTPPQASLWASRPEKTLRRHEISK